MFCGIIHVINVRLETLTSLLLFGIWHYSGCATIAFLFIICTNRGWKKVSGKKSGNNVVKTCLPQSKNLTACFYHHQDL